MKASGLVTVFRTLPSRNRRLHELAYNVWWSWHPEARALYSSLDPDLWEHVRHNPVRWLSEVQLQVLEQASHDPDYLQRYDSMLGEFDEYMYPRPGATWFSRTYPELTNQTVAYFSAEFGLDESLSIYSGGLGMLAGDHAKEASDLGLPYIGVGMLYAEGYFQQRIPRDGTQEAFYDEIRRGICMEQNHYQQARELAAWEERIRRVWPGPGLYVSGLRDGHFDLGAGIDIHAWVRADTLHPEDIGVDVVYDGFANGTDDHHVPQQTSPIVCTRREQDGAYRYDLHFQPAEGGTLAYGVRVLPNHTDLPNVYDWGGVENPQPMPSGPIPWQSCPHSLLLTLPPTGERHIETADYFTSGQKSLYSFIEGRSNHVGYP